MAGEGRTPSTKNARTVDQRGAGTGQHVTAAVDAGEGIKAPRSDDSPTKITGPQPVFSNTRRGEATGIDIQPPSAELSAKMLRDSGAKTAREREFNTAMKDFGRPLDGASERAMFPSGLEQGTLAEIAQGDKFAGTKTKLPRYKTQAQ